MFNIYNIKKKINYFFIIFLTILVTLIYIKFFSTDLDCQIIYNAFHPYQSNFILHKTQLTFFHDVSMIQNIILFDQIEQKHKYFSSEINNVLTILEESSKHQKIYKRKLRLDNNLKEILLCNQTLESCTLYLNNKYFNYTWVYQNILNNDFKTPNAFRKFFWHNENVHFLFDIKSNKWSMERNNYIEHIIKLTRIWDRVWCDYIFEKQTDSIMDVLIFPETRQYLLNYYTNIICRINYVLLIINNLYDINFFFMTATTTFIFIVYYNDILIYKTINLYMFLLYLVAMFSFFGLNPYIGFLVLVELMTITYITILVLNFTNYFSFTNKNKFNKYVIYLMFIIYPCVADYYLIFWVSDDLIFSYYDFYDFILTNDFIGIYIYLYFDNVLFMLSIATSFILFSVLFIKIIFVSFIEKVKNMSILGDKLMSFFYEFRVNFYEKNFFWEKDFFNVVNFFK